MKNNYQKYIILSTYRSGTNLLSGLLNSHPRIVSFGEIFRDDFFLRAPLWKLLQHYFPIFFLNRYVFHDYPNLIKAVGFKLQYDHARVGSIKSIWKYIHDHKDIKIIHLKRKNKLATYLSYLVAHKARQWITTKSYSLPRYRIEIDPQACATYFAAIDRYRIWCDMYFKDHRVLEIFYEDLAANQYDAIQTIQAFLHLGSHPLSTPLKKQNTQPLEERILNYSELKKYFAYTPWATFFSHAIPQSYFPAKKIGVFIPYCDPNQPADIAKTNALLQKLSSYKHVVIYVQLHSNWDKVTAPNNCTVVDIFSKAKQRELLQACRYIVDFGDRPIQKHNHKTSIVSTETLLAKLSFDVCG